MNHLKQIAAKLPEYGVDAMMLTSAPGEFYAVGFHGEGTNSSDVRFITAISSIFTLFFYVIYRHSAPKQK